jgi:hypothetical protein
MNVEGSSREVIVRIVGRMKAGEPIMEAPGGLDAECRGMNQYLYDAIRNSVFMASIFPYYEDECLSSGSESPPIRRHEVFEMYMHARGVYW